MISLIKLIVAWFRLKYIKMHTNLERHETTLLEAKLKRMQLRQQFSKKPTVVQFDSDFSTRQPTAMEAESLIENAIACARQYQHTKEFTYMRILHTYTCRYNSTLLMKGYCKAAFSDNKIELKEVKDEGSD